MADNIQPHTWSWQVRVDTYCKNRYFEIVYLWTNIFSESNTVMMRISSISPSASNSPSLSIYISIFLSIYLYIYAGHYIETWRIYKLTAQTDTAYKQTRLWPAEIERIVGIDWDWVHGMRERWTHYNDIIAHAALCTCADRIESTWRINQEYQMT